MANDEDHHAAASQTSNDDNLFVTSDKDNTAIDTDPVEPPEDVDMNADIEKPTNNVPTHHSPDPAGHVSDMPSGMEVTHSESVAQAADHGAETARLLREAALKKQKYFAQKFREKKAAQEAAVDSSDVPDEDEDTDNHAKIERSARGKHAPSARFKKQEQAFLKKQAAGKLSEEEEIAFMKAEQEETARLRKLEADEEFDRSPSPDNSDDGGLFVEEGPSGISYSEMHSDNDEPPEPKKKGRKRKAAQNDDDEKPRKRSKPKNGGKKDRQVEGTKYTERDLEHVLGEAKQQGQKGKPKQTAKGKGRQANMKKSGSGLVNFGSLGGTNLFNDAAAVANLPVQPRFTEGGEGGTRQKNKALKQLMATVPTESKKIATTDKRALDAATKDFNGVGSVYPKGDGLWGLKGLRASLKHYQVLGAAFMRRRENASQQPRGGILADEMGLGKTIMMLANIVNGKPGDKKKPRATLIIASPALVSQWVREIRTHCQSRGETKHGIDIVLEHRAGSRIKANNPEQLLESADIVLTTYHEIMKSYPKAIVPTELTTAAQKDAWWKGFYDENRGILHRVKWLRVVLDEAQAIKNHKSHTSMACRALTAQHYWAITGTPIMNNTKEFYSYLRLIREPNTGSFKIFCQNFCHPDDEDGLEKLNVFLRKVMVRRTHSDTLFNAKLLDLPVPKEHNLWLEFSDIERQVYEIVKKRFVARINNMAKQEGLQKNFSHIWTMILRLRQICCHLLLIEGTIIDLLEREDFEKLNTLTQNEDDTGDEGSALLKHLRHALQSNKGVKTIEGGLTNSILTEHESIPLDATMMNDDEGDTGQKHGIYFRFRKYLENLMESEHWEAIKQRTTCCACRQLPKNPQVTSCFHIYCMTCLNDLQHMAAARGYDRTKCSECGESYTGTQPCEDLETFDNRETSTSPNGAPKPKPKKGKKDENWLTVAGEILPSAKTRAVKAQILNWIDEDENVKIILYTQFLDVIRILGRVCDTERWSYVTYSGAMSHDARDNAIQEFTGAPGMKIMLASLKCGGQGLNLTQASRVICLDPWWNMATENQAFARVYRIGQVQETKFLRVVVKNTIDAAMMATKDRKQVDIDAVMQSKGKLDVRDLMRLFGKVGEDDEGHPFIFAEGADRFDENDPTRLAEDDENDEMGFMGNEA